MVAEGFENTATKAEFDQLSSRVDGVEEKLTAKIEGLGNRIDDLADKVQTVHNLIEADILSRVSKLEDAVYQR